VKTREFVTLEQRLLPSLPGYAVKGRMMIVVPVVHTLRGFYFEPSGFSSKKFYVNMFFMPLCVPAKHVHFTFGHRVGHGWDAKEPDLETKLKAAMKGDMRFLLGLRTPKDTAKALEPLTTGNPVTGYVNPHCYEALAYTLITAGELAGAATVIDNLLRSVNFSVSWEAEIASRAQLMKEKLSENPERANQQLLTWEAETVRNLGLEALQQHIE